MLSKLISTLYFLFSTQRVPICLSLIHLFSIILPHTPLFFSIRINFKSFCVLFFLLPFAWVVSYITFYICIEQTTQNIKLGFIFAVLISAAYPVTYRFKKFFFMQYLIQKNIINGDNLQRGFIHKKSEKTVFPLPF